MSQDLKAVLDEIHLELARQLLERVKSGEASSSDLNVARQFLKDNHVDSAMAQDPHLMALARAAAAARPHFDEDDIRASLSH